MINSFFSYIKNNYSVVITLILFAALELPFLSLARPILTDEAWYSNPAYNFLTLHSFENTNVGYGGNGLLIFLLYLSSSFFVLGVSLFSIRLSSFIMGVVSLFIVAKMLKILNVKEFNRLLSLSFFIFANLYLSIFKLGRPEALAFMLSLNILLVTYYYIIKNFDFKYMALMVVLIFLAINSHPNSSIIVLLSFLVILFYVIKEKQFKKIFHLALIVAAVAVSLYVMISVISMNNKIGIVDSMNDLVDRNAVNSGFIEQLISKYDVTIEYFVSSSRLITFIPQVLLIISGLFMWKKNKYLFGLSLCGLASLFIAFIFLAPPGFIYVFPYVFIFSVLILSVLLKTYNNNIAGKALSAIVIVIVLLNIIAYITLTRKTYDSNIGTKMKEIAALIPDNSITISVPPFWFISPEKNFKTARYFRDRNLNLGDKDFYVINCDKFESDVMASSSSLASLDPNSSSRKIDTLLIKNSSIYGNIYLMKYSVNSIK